MIPELNAPVRIETGLPREEVIARLQRSIEVPGFFNAWTGVAEIVGKVGSEHCWFEIGGRQRLKRRLNMMYVDRTQGTILIGKFGPAREQLYFLLLWLVIGLFLCFISLTQLVDQWRSGGGFHAEYLIPFGILLGGLSIVRLNVLLGHRTEDEVIEKLQEILRGLPRSGHAEMSSAPVSGEVVIRPRRRMP